MPNLVRLGSFKWDLVSNVNVKTKAEQVGKNQCSK